MSTTLVRHTLGPGYTVHLPSGKRVRFSADSAELEVSKEVGVELVRSGVCVPVNRPKGRKAKPKPRKKTKPATTAAESSD